MTTEITSSVNATSKSQSSNASSSSVMTQDVMGKEEFLTLLVAQLQHQDPLNPDEGTEFTAQLAQFSSLEQLMSINENIGAMNTASANSDNIALLNTIGKDVLYSGDSFKYSEGSIEVGYLLPVDATSAKIDITLNGQIVKTINGTDLSKGPHTYVWDGLNTEGNQAPAGDYKISVTAENATGAIDAGPLLKSSVTGVNLDPLLGASLNTTIGDIESYAYILGIYDKGTNSN